MQAASGVSTLLFTDIEGSTELWEQEAERMSRALAQHDALSRAAVEGNNGVVVKMTGDGMCAAFGDPLDAVNAALALLQSLIDPTATNEISLKVRCGLHVGVVEQRDDDVFGSPVNRAARIMSAAHGGQVLLSEAVVDCVRERLPPSTSLRDIGRVRLRGLATPEHVYQVVHPPLRKDFPALRSLETTPNNLPQQATSFIGRERELVESRELLQRTRLLTLLGMGGMGKTRLSLQIAADVMGKYPDGVWFVDLAPIRDPSLVVNEAAQVLGVHEEAGKPLLQTLCAHVKQRKPLFILDNCEHLLGASASLADSLLRSAPDVRILATSREALHIRGEQTYPVLPLAVPDRKAGVESLLRSESVQLFVERARLQRPGFSLTEREAPAVAELCSRLDGIPLALELAAARMRSLSTHEINARLHDRFKLLTGGNRVDLERQQTLRALVGWSYDLLQENERIFLDRLSVFVGGFDLAAAENVCGQAPLMPGDVLDLVSSLVEKSLVMVEQSDKESRYRLLETISDYARERLIKRDDVTATAARHCNYFLEFAKTARDNLRGPEQAEWTGRLEVELDNLRAAIALALAGGVDPAIAVKFEVALMRFWILRGYSTEGRNNVRAALALPEIQAPTAARAYALYVGGVLATNQSDHAEAKRMLTECLALHRTLKNSREIAAALSTLATLHLQQGDAATAHGFEEEALGIFREMGDQLGEGVGLLHLGEMCVQLADLDGARERFEQCLQIARSIRHQELESECERNIGSLAVGTGDLQAAHARFTRSLKICRDAQDKRGEAITLWQLGKTDTARGDHDSASKSLVDALRALRAFEMNAEALDCLEDYATLLRAASRPDVAVRIYAATAAVREALALPRPTRREGETQKCVAAAQAALGESAFNVAWSIGRAWTLDEAVDCALASTVIPPVAAGAAVKVN